MQGQDHTIPCPAEPEVKEEARRRTIGERNVLHSCLGRSCYIELWYGGCESLRSDQQHCAIWHAKAPIDNACFLTLTDDCMRMSDATTDEKS